MKVFRYGSKIEDIPKRCPTIFLAGPTVRGNQPHLISWRGAALQILECAEFDGAVIVPEFEDKKESDQYRYDLPPWEFAGLNRANTILFWVPRTKELIGLTTNFEFGYWMGRERWKIVYGRPDHSYRNTYLDIMWVEDGKRTLCKFPIYNTLEKTVAATLKHLRGIRE